MRCVDKDPAQRPQTAEELGKALEAALSTAGDDGQTAAVVPVLVQQPQQPVAAAPAAPAAPPMDTFSPPPGRTASDLTIAAGPPSPAAGVGRRGGGRDRGHRGVPAGRSPRRRRQGSARAGGRCPGAACGRLGREAAAGARARRREGGRRRARARRRQAGGGRRARGPGPRSGPGRVARAARRGRRIGRRTSGSSRSRRARRRSWKCRFPPRLPPPSRSCRRRTGNGATAPSGRSRRPRWVPVRRASRPPHRRLRQNPDTATAWSATTSSAANSRRFCASRLARRTRRCFDRGACRA